MGRKYDLRHMLRYPANVTSRDLRAAARAYGWMEIRSTGHEQFAKGTRRVSIPDPVHGLGTIRAILIALLEGEND